LKNSPPIWPLHSHCSKVAAWHHTCRGLQTLLKAIICPNQASSFRIYFRVKYPIDKAISKLQSLATTKTLSRGLSCSSRHLCIGPLSLMRFEDYEKSRISVAMRVYLFDALDALQSLRRVTYYVIILFYVLALPRPNYFAGGSKLLADC